MKHNKNHDNVMSEGPQLEPFRFESTHPTARNVCVAGSFNDWHAEGKPMHSVGDGRSLKETVYPKLGKKVAVLIPHAELVPIEKLRPYSTF